LVRRSELLTQDQQKRANRSRLHQGRQTLSKHHRHARSSLGCPRIVRRFPPASNENRDANDNSADTWPTEAFFLRVKSDYWRADGELNDDCRYTGGYEQRSDSSVNLVHVGGSGDDYVEVGVA
jgi:hypothetical protein